MCSLVQIFVVSEIIQFINYTVKNFIIKDQHKPESEPHCKLGTGVDNNALTNKYATLAAWLQWAIKGYCSGR